LRIVALVVGLMALARPMAATDEATLLRVFLQDGTSLISYGELARVGDRVVFSMPTSAAMADPQLHLVTLPAERVDWRRTDRYAESARAARYVATRAEADYAALSGEIADALNAVGRTTDPKARLAIVERARKTLADWPAQHYDYKHAEVRDLLPLLDDAIADLRAMAGVEQFALSLVAGSDAPVVREPLLPVPTPQEAIMQTLMAARLTAAPAERTSLLAVALASLEREAASLPSQWVAATRAAASAAIAREIETDRQYMQLTSRVLGQASERARAADVRGVERLMAEVRQRDKELGASRADAVNALLAAVEAELDAARRLRLARDRWELRVPLFRKYNDAIESPLERLKRLRPSLEDIRSFAGSSPDALASIQSATAEILERVSAIVPPEEFQAAHALLVSAAHLADSAARIRREATLTGDMSRAWDASSAAAGALMLDARVRVDIEVLFRFPQLPQ
jgi:hypothetical protein